MLLEKACGPQPSTSKSGQVKIGAKNSNAAKVSV